MATVTVDEVKDLTGTSLSDAIISAQISIVISRAGACLDANYDESSANLIALYTASAMADISDPSSKIKSERAANGAGTTYQDRTFNASTFENNQYGSMAKMLDSAGCLNSLFPATAGIRVSGPCGAMR